MSPEGTATPWTREALADPLKLARALIARRSVTPEDDGALAVLAEAAEALGFRAWPLRFEEAGTPPVDNLYARRGEARPVFCFAGHTDVVPVGQGWTVEPFDPLVRDGVLYGRGAADMKGAIAAFIAATARFLAEGEPPGGIALLITGDEEGPAINGTRKVLDWMAANGESIDACLVGEPTNPHRLGEMVKIGRRGSLNVRLTVFGTQGHAAYPHLADNPIDRLVDMLARLKANPLDQGSAHFPASTIAITSVDVGNAATNVIPGSARANFNVRFNDLHDSAAVLARLRALFAPEEGQYELTASVSGESFLTPPGPFVTLISDAVREELGAPPELSTTGGTSDARFIKDVCQVAEFGLVGETMHKADERVRVEDLEALTRIYLRVLRGYFSAAPGTR